MNDSKEFLGKTLDAAIAEACSYYGTPREKLEIELLEDAKTGIFGIVGARKAKIRAKLATLPDFVQASSPRTEKQENRKKTRDERYKDKNDSSESVTEELYTNTAETSASDTVKEPRKNNRKETRNRRNKDFAKNNRSDISSSDSANTGTETNINPDQKQRLPALRPETKDCLPAISGKNLPYPEVSLSTADSRTEEPHDDIQSGGRVRSAHTGKNEDAETTESLLPRIPLANLDQTKLIESTRTIISTLVAPILSVEPEDVELALEIGEDRLQVSIKSTDTGLLIGRDGQNLAAVQYLASRMITRVIGSQVRLQVDAGDYHVRQDTRLQELALNLAEKVKTTGKVQTTRPLSAYQRRVIHLALQDDPDVQTRSSGDGALKHVVILRRKD